RNQGIGQVSGTDTEIFKRVVQEKRKRVSKIKEIVEGHANEFLANIGIKQNKDVQKVFDSREAICNACPLKKGNTCDPTKYINPNTMEVRTTPAKGFFKGCGCRLSAKQRSQSSKCPAGFWGGEFN